ncbi:response regulator transcription factor [Roseateles saccharophilus]|uniref:DNA-binding response OmpR family regulator n=1 Tax=Roseateles saccharophilus TaxID=304 RepID=A0A4R3ULI5_ROSSA|nr:response regulator transcription factor [Roseateles saccharophilus]MDG0833533.1 response regulator transcription factor [Roseateles saccharophilus]TCU92556.1 DNA-binding response OmpR family regulator [Roseateles saccharophilus]
MLPKTLALIDDDREYAELLAGYLRERGVAVRVFADSNDLLGDLQSHGYDFYVVDLMLPGIDGVDLIKILRKRSRAGVLVVSGRLGMEVFTNVITVGADMYLAKPVQFEQIEVAIKAVHRRVAESQISAARWRLDRQARALVAPDGARVDLSEADVAVLECFVQASGTVVTREALRQRLGRGPNEEGSDGINATIYRLRRRIERATPALVPLQSKSRVGYVFQAPLTVD